MRESVEIVWQAAKATKLNLQANLEPIHAACAFGPSEIAPK